MNLTELLKNRRVWAGLVGVSGFIAGLTGLAWNYDAETLTGLLTALGQALSALVPAVLALWSFFKPKKNV